MAIKRFTSFSLVFLATATLLLAGQAAAHDLCDSSDYVPICKKYAEGINDARQATEKLINALIRETTAVKNMLSKIGNNPQIKDCNSHYGDAINNLKDSLDNIKQNDKAGLMDNLSACITEYETCQDGFFEAHLASPLGAPNRMMRSMASNCLAVASKIKL